MTDPAGGFRVDAPQPEKSRQEEAPDLLERLLVDMANAASDLHGMCSHEGFTDAVTVLRGGTPLLVGEVRRLGEALQQAQRENEQLTAEAADRLRQFNTAKDQRDTAERMARAASAALAPLPAEDIPHEH